MTEGNLKFQRFTSAIEVPFWNALKTHKLNTAKLSTAPIPISGFYAGPIHASVGPMFSIDHTAFSSSPNPGVTMCPGEVINVNTMEEFRALNFKELLKSSAQYVEEAIDSKTVFDHPNELFRFVLVTFADLKRHKFYYWAGFPTFKGYTFLVNSSEAVGSVFSEDDLAIIAGVSTACIIRKGNTSCKILSLGDYQEGDFLVYIDPSASAHPGWGARNLLIMAQRLYGGSQFKLLSLITMKGSSSNSVVYHLNVTAPSAPLGVTGWELNESGKPQPRSIDLSNLMDPIKLAENSVDLNLRLMRWRLLPSLEVDRIASTKCLLLGAGTLGCAVAQSLIGWGVRNITFVDSGKVSYSNPVRQSLYEFADCKGEGRFKAEAAAERLMKIFPGITASSHVMSVPMPGHPVAENEVQEVSNTISLLQEMIIEHDAIFLLMDSREARWLPTMLAKASDKLLLNVALGFDTFVIQRHGGLPTIENPETLGCYFCADVVAPTDSFKDRTLDQQCTVTRPGLAPIASAMSVELLVGLLHHPDFNHAPASQAIPLNSRTPFELGLLPHQIRGYMAHFQTIFATSSAYDHCTGCSPPIIAAYKADPIGFVLQVLNSTPSFLERVSGLEQQKELTDELDLDWDSDV